MSNLVTKSRKLFMNTEANSEKGSFLSRRKYS